MVFRRLPGVYADQLPLGGRSVMQLADLAQSYNFLSCKSICFSEIFSVFLTSLRIIAPNPLPETVNLHQKIISSTPTPLLRELLIRIINPLSLSQ